MRCFLLKPSFLERYVQTLSDTRKSDPLLLSEIDSAIIWTNNLSHFANRFIDSLHISNYLVEVRGLPREEPIILVLLKLVSMFDGCLAKHYLARRVLKMLIRGLKLIKDSFLVNIVSVEAHSFSDVAMVVLQGDIAIHLPCHDSASYRTHDSSQR